MIRKKNKNVSFNCGLIGILLACYYSPKRITIFGMDFYANKYFNSKEKYMEKKEMLKVIILKDKFFNCFKTIVSLFKNINFEICTYYKNELNKKNLVKIL